jgi:hypothetical protein
MGMETGSAMGRDAQLALCSAGYDALVLHARFRQSLASARSLGSRGLCIAALEAVDGLPAPAFSSRSCRYKGVCPGLEGTQGSTHARVLITSSNGTIALIRLHREGLERRVRIAQAKEAALALAVNKEQTLEVARRLGIGAPRAVTVGTGSEVNEDKKYVYIVDKL